MKPPYWVWGPTPAAVTDAMSLRNFPVSEPGKSKADGDKAIFNHVVTGRAACLSNETLPLSSHTDWTRQKHVTQGGPMSIFRWKPPKIWRRRAQSWTGCILAAGLCSLEVARNCFAHWEMGNQRLIDPLPHSGTSFPFSRSPSWSPLFCLHYSIDVYINVFALFSKRLRFLMVTWFNYWLIKINWLNQNKLV